MQRTDGKSTLCTNAVTHLMLLFWYYVTIHRLGFHFQHAWAHTSCIGGFEICSNKQGGFIYSSQNKLLVCWGFLFSFYWCGETFIYETTGFEVILFNFYLYDKLMHYLFQGGRYKTSN